VYYGGFGTSESVTNNPTITHSFVVTGGAAHVTVSENGLIYTKCNPDAIASLMDEREGIVIQEVGTAARAFATKNGETERSQQDTSDDCDCAALFIIWRMVDLT
jgi:hypothetical protein